MSYRNIDKCWRLPIEVRHHKLNKASKYPPRMPKYAKKS